MKTPTPDAGTGTPAGLPSDQQKPQSPTPTERPTWLPDKFKDPEQLAFAYAELEKKLSAPKQEEPAPAKPTEEVKPPVDAPKPDDATKVAEQLAADGIDVDSMSSRFWESGELAADDRTKLVEALGKSFGKEKAESLIDSFAKSQLIAKEYVDQQVYAPLGGKGKEAPMIEWAKTSLSKAQAEAINAMWDSGDVDKMAAGSKTLADLYHAANGKAPTVVLTGDQTTSSVEVYTHKDQLLKDMADPRYRTDASFRELVSKKLARSKDI